MNPMTALARALAERGHRVTLIHRADAASFADEGSPFGFEPVGSGTHPEGSLAAEVRTQARADTPWGLWGVLRDVDGRSAIFPPEGDTLQDAEEDQERGGERSGLCIGGQQTNQECRAAH